MCKKCIWCLEDENKVSFNKKAHTIPKSLGGQNFNKLVCDSCNEFFGSTTKSNGYSIEEALKETFCISRQRFLSHRKTKRQVGTFKSKFFDIKDRNGKLRLVVKPAFLLKTEFQKELCRNFKRGLIKMWFEEYDRQTSHRYSYDEKFHYIRSFARFNQGDLPVLYFERNAGILILTKSEAETPVLILNRMGYLLHDEIFTEIEFLGHVFGFPFANCSIEDFNNYIGQSLEMKKQFFKQASIIEKLLDVDFTLKIMNT